MDAQQQAQEAISTLYRELMERWNARDAAGFAAIFANDGLSIGFDGSTMSGPAEIGATLGQIFADHVTATYIGKIRVVRMLSAESALLWAIVGMVPRGGADINPAVNALQTIVAIQRDGEWRIALLQNTPAQFHGRPEAAEAHTQELRALL